MASMGRTHLLTGEDAEIGLHAGRGEALLKLKTSARRAGRIFVTSFTHKGCGLTAVLRKDSLEEREFKSLKAGSY
jgi:hypothetical protein